MTHIAVSERDAAGVPPAARPPMVRIEGVWKSFPKRRTVREGLRHPFRREMLPSLQNVTCDIAEGEFFGLLGPNGAGKTTLFKVLSTLVLPDRGRATVAGFDVSRDGDAVRRILAPVVAGERTLQWRLPARENLRLYAALYRIPPREVRARIEEVLEAVQLTETGEKIVGTFSSGMKQRLMIARALLARPRVLLLDEPTRSLDPVSARAFRTFLHDEVARRQGCTILLATHSAEEALQLCDRVGVLDRGRLLAVGTSAELSRTFGDEAYRAWTTTPAHPAWAQVAADGLVKQVRVREVDEFGWTELEMEIPGGLDRAAETLARLTAAGARVARFEQVTLSLADLIERVVQRSV